MALKMALRTNNQEKWYKLPLKNEENPTKIIKMASKQRPQYGQSTRLPLVWSNLSTKFDLRSTSQNILHKEKAR